MQTFLEYYQKEIEPKIAAVDIFLKTEEAPYSPEEVAQCLGISEQELQELLEKYQLGFITKGIFFLLMKTANSPFCKIFQRELSCGMPTLYDWSKISYIYQLEERAVRHAVNLLGRTFFTNAELPLVFSKISVGSKKS